MRKEYAGLHTWHHELKVWSHEWAYPEWKVIVLGLMTAHEETLLMFFEAKWEPNACHQYMLLNKMLYPHPKPRKEPKLRVVVLDVEAINKQFGLCLWRECGKLLSRRMTPEARQLVCDMQTRMEKQAGIIVYPSIVVRA